jgi:metal-responsive CopG/Arc/MetJ family transcriptional regulator
MSSASHSIGVKLPAELYERLEKLRERKYCDRANVVRDAIAAYVTAEEHRLALLDAQTKADLAAFKVTEAA